MTQTELRRKILISLFERKVQTILIGGLAVRAHGGHRLTEDMDMAARIIDADVIINIMYDMGYKIPRRIDSDGNPIWITSAAEAKQAFTDRMLGATNFYFEGADGDIVDQTDFVFENPVPFGRLMEHARRISENPPLVVACVQHLIQMKENRLRKGEGSTNDEQDLKFLKSLCSYQPDTTQTHETGDTGPRRRTPRGTAGR